MIITKHYHFDTVDSTNFKAKRLAEEGCETGTLITADMQEYGVGRTGRNWSSERNAGIYMSMVLRPRMDMKNVSMITLIAAMSVAGVLEKHGVLPAGTPCIKWPNDIVIHKKKICGILTELILDGVEINYIVLGIGINVSNQSFPEEIKETASSILLETGQNIEKEVLIADIWNLFETYYHRLLFADDFSEFKEEYERYLLNKNQHVLVLERRGNYEGIAQGINNKGELIVDTGEEKKRVSGGEVSVRGIYGYV